LDALPQFKLKTRNFGIGRGRSRGQNGERAPAAAGSGELASHAVAARGLPNGRQGRVAHAQRAEDEVIHVTEGRLKYSKFSFMLHKNIQNSLPSS
jgi:hypothetical protein